MRDWMDDAPTVSFYEKDTRRARVERKCDACPDPIRAGDRYARLKSVVDGKFSMACVHVICPYEYRELDEHHPLDAAHPMERSSR